MQIRKQFGRSTIFIGFIKRFQWVGFIISTDNVLWKEDNYFLFEFRLLFVRFWYMYDFKTKNKNNAKKN